LVKEFVKYILKMWCCRGDCVAVEIGSVAAVEIGNGLNCCQLSPLAPP
jgi:hypothetical protein